MQSAEIHTLFCAQCGNNAISRGSEYECIEMSKKGQTSVNNAEGSGRRCTSTGRNESHGSRGWKSQCRRNCAKIKSEHIPYYTTTLGSARFVQGGCLGNWQEDHKGRRMDMFSSSLKLYRSEAYSLDLVSSDFHLFEPIKEALRGRRFANDDEVNGAVYDWLRTQPKTFDFDACKKLVDH